MSAQAAEAGRGSLHWLPQTPVTGPLNILSPAQLCEELLHILGKQHQTLNIPATQHPRGELCDGPVCGQGLWRRGGALGRDRGL